MNPLQRLFMLRYSDRCYNWCLFLKQQRLQRRYFITTTDTSGLKFVSPLLPSHYHKQNSVPCRIVFGSCSSQSINSNKTDQLMYWDRMIEQKPDLILLMGDNVYAPKSTNNDDKSCKNDMSNAYRTLGSHPSFGRAATTIPMIATLDDNDYNLKYYDKMKHILSKTERDEGFEQAKHQFLNFFQIPTNDLRYSNQRGVYTSYDYIMYENGTMNVHCSTALQHLGCNMDHPNRNKIVFRLQIIVLDVRRHKSAFVTQPIPTNNTNDDNFCVGPYIPSHHDGDKYTMLGSQQWQWLEEQLQACQPNPSSNSSSILLSSPPTLRIIVSAIQVLSDGRHGWDCWSLFPHERERLLDLLFNPSKLTVCSKSEEFRTERVPKTILLSGDRHVAGFYEHLHKSNGAATTTITEVTSSSLTHSVPSGLLDNEHDTKRIGDFIYGNNFGMMELLFDPTTIANDDTTKSITCKMNLHCANTGAVLHSKIV